MVVTNKGNSISTYLYMQKKNIERLIFTDNFCADQNIIAINPVEGTRDSVVHDTLSLQ